LRLKFQEVEIFRSPTGLYAIDKETGIFGEAVPVGHATQDKEVLLLNNAGKELNFHEIGEIAVRSR
jgi:hypothetical protein